MNKNNYLVSFFLFIIMSLFIGCSDDDTLQSEKKSNGAIEGKVSDSLSNLAISSASVQIQPDGIYTTTDENGYYLFDDLKSGSYYLGISVEGFKPEMSEIKVAANSTMKLNLLLNRLHKSYDTSNVLLHIGEEFNYSDFVLKFVDIIGDSRCPKSVVCKWEGRVDAVFQVKDFSHNEKFDTLKIHGLSFPPQPDTMLFQNYKIILRDIIPYPDTPAAIPKYQYEALLSITKN
ncbi:MAG: carboxypeptidase-like regulatory domain-containing protein [Bacteroidetes bacterium]|nr:carboxypeptidase-like regulatory domain-containing protein [Bacteroidota bacterium]